MEGSADVNGVRFNFYDTAGIRETENDIENLGVRLSEKTVNGSDIILFVLSATDISADDEKVYDLIKGKRVITVVNKTDAGDLKDARADLYISAKKNTGIADLRNLLYERTVGQVDLNGDFLCEERHFYALKNARKKLENALNAADDTPLDILSVDILAAWQYFGEISGKTAAEEIIDDIFSRFCVGK